MRMIPILALSCLALTACGEGSALDESVKTTVRQQLVATCTATAEGQIPEGLTVDLDKVCDCAADKVMDGKSVQDLVTNPPTSTPTETPTKTPTPSITSGESASAFVKQAVMNKLRDSASTSP